MDSAGRFSMQVWMEQDLTVDVILIAALGLALSLAAIHDLRSRRIPNILTYPLMAVALAAHGLTHGSAGVLFSGEGLLLGVGMLMLPYLLGGMGAGDAKLLGAVGAVLGPNRVFVCFLFAAVAGGIYALVLFLLRRRESPKLVPETWISLKALALTGQLVSIAAPREVKKPVLCFGVAIAVGTFVYLFLEIWGHGFPLRISASMGTG